MIAKKSVFAAATLAMSCIALCATISPWAMGHIFSGRKILLT
jgi:hypothetical protein